jgi:small subunit ribosomal protein S15
MQCALSALCGKSICIAYIITLIGGGIDMAFIGEKDKKEIVESNQLHGTDTGSSEVQIALLTERINHLVEHLKKNHKDHSTRRGLLIMVGRRRKLLTYLRRRNIESYQALTQKLNLRTKD